VREVVCIQLWIDLGTVKEIISHSIRIHSSSKRNDREKETRKEMSFAGYMLVTHSNISWSFRLRVLW
jgi:hypothetical protein